MEQLFQTLKRVYKTSKTSFRHIPMQFLERSTAVFETPMPDKGGYRLCYSPTYSFPFITLRVTTRKCHSFDP
ncbi:MAG: hypothetical protein J6V54_01570 [Bacteroidales bacterium]|nr:hypothetical protein [Bacteroidales bacterium]